MREMALKNFSNLCPVAKRPKPCAQLHNTTAARQIAAEMILATKNLKSGSDSCSSFDRNNVCLSHRGSGESAIGPNWKASSTARAFPLRCSEDDEEKTSRNLFGVNCSQATPRVYKRHRQFSAELASIFSHSNSTADDSLPQLEKVHFQGAVDLHQTLLGLASLSPSVTAGSGDVNDEIEIAPTCPGSVDFTSSWAAGSRRERWLWGVHREADRLWMQGDGI